MSVPTCRPRRKPAVTELTSFLSALTGVKAGAIIGTECDVYSDLALDFALYLLGAMTGRIDEPGARAGQGQVSAPTSALQFAPAIRLARHHIVIGKEDPRGFAFSAFGPAELSLVQA